MHRMYRYALSVTRHSSTPIIGGGARAKYRSALLNWALGGSKERSTVQKAPLFFSLHHRQKIVSNKTEQYILFIRVSKDNTNSVGVSMDRNMENEELDLISVEKLCSLIADYDVMQENLYLFLGSKSEKMMRDMFDYVYTSSDRYVIIQGITNGIIRRDSVLLKRMLFSFIDSLIIIAYNAETVQDWDELKTKLFSRLYDIPNLKKMLRYIDNIIATITKNIDELATENDYLGKVCNKHSLSALFMYSIKPPLDIAYGVLSNARDRLHGDEYERLVIETILKCLNRMKHNISQISDNDLLCSTSYLLRKIINVLHL